MRLIIRFMIITSLALLVNACGNKKNTKERIGRHARTDGTHRTGTTAQNSTLTGGVFGVQSVFTTAIQNFVSNLIEDPQDPNQFGFVDGENNGVTGMRIGVHNGQKFEMQSGSFNGNAQNWGAFRQDRGHFAMEILDQIAVDSKDERDAIPFDKFQLVFSEIAGTNITMEFEDDLGHITLTGYYNSNYFEGTLHYKNNSYKNGSPGGAENYFGFVIPTCDFIRCQ